MGARIYGHRRGKRNILRGYPVAASQVFTDGGKFVKLDANERLDVAASGDTEVYGWAVCGEFTSNSTAGVDTIEVDVSTDSEYYIPANAVVTRDLVGKTCDLAVDGNNIQSADVGESNEDVLIVTEVDVANQAVFVRLNSNKVAATGVV